MAHWQYILWALGGPAGLATACRYVPRMFLMLVGGLTTNPQRSKQIERMIILSRRDAKDILKVQAEAPEPAKPPPPQADPAGTGISSTASALKAVPDRSAPASLQRSSPRRRRARPPRPRSGAAPDPAPPSAAAQPPVPKAPRRQPRRPGSVA